MLEWLKARVGRMRGRSQGGLPIGDLAGPEWDDMPEILSVSSGWVRRRRATPPPLPPDARRPPPTLVPAPAGRV